MEMELLSKKVRSGDVGVEKTDRSSAHEIVGCKVVSWLLCLLDWEEERFDCLVELVGCARINDLIVKSEIGIFEIFLDGLSRIKVDRGASDHAGVRIEVEALTWSLIDGVLVILGVVIHELVLMLFDTVWGAELILYHVIRVWPLLDSIHPIDSILENTILLHLLESSILDVVLREFALDRSHGEHASHDDILSLVLSFVKILPFGVRRI